MNAIIDRSEIEKWDKRRTAFHEAGHAVVALAVGSKWVRTHIWRNPTDKPFEEMTWLGQCSQHNGDEESNAIIGIAGAVSETIMDGGWRDDWCWFRFDEWDMSETDESMVGEWDLEHIAHKAHAILTDRWELVEAIASELIENEILTDGMILEMADKGAVAA